VTFFPEFTILVSVREDFYMRRPVGMRFAKIILVESWRNLINKGDCLWLYGFMR
jgi:hypothetical protein